MDTQIHTHAYNKEHIYAGTYIYTPTNFAGGVYTVFTLSVCVCVRACVRP